MVEHSHGGHGGHGGHHVHHLKDGFKVAPIKVRHVDVTVVAQVPKVLLELLGETLLLILLVPP
jgi:hypothetical protein